MTADDPLCRRNLLGRQLYAIHREDDAEADQHEEIGQRKQDDDVAGEALPDLKIAKYDLIGSGREFADFGI